jgi:hypothetical protein
MSRDVQVPRPDPFPADRQVPVVVPIFIPVPVPYPVPQVVPVVPWWPQQPYHPCAFDGLPPGVYGLVCQCPRCTTTCM